jgi:signal transduction histidine kinase
VPDLRGDSSEARFIDSTRDGVFVQLGRGAQIIPAALIVITLVAILLVPLLVNRRAEAVRNEIAYQLDPARDAVTELNAQLAIASSALRGWLLTDDGMLLRYNVARQRMASALGQLERLMSRLGPETRRGYEELIPLINRYNRYHDELLMGNVSREEFIRRLPEVQATYEETIRALALVRHQLAVGEAARRQQVFDLQRTGAYLTIGLVALAFAASLTVFWLTRRLRLFASEVRRRAEDEQAFRKVASALSGATDIDEILLEIGRGACRISGADAVYIEVALPEENVVEVVTTLGRKTPTLGLRVPYPGSLTDEVIRSREPVVIRSLDEIGAAMAPYLTEHCSGCELLTIPLMGNREPLGALVLIDSDSVHRKFDRAVIGKARLLGDIASVGLRRVRLMENEQLARRAAEEAAQDREDVLAIVSHDLRNPLTAVQLSTSWLQEIAPEEMKEELSSVLVSVKRMERLINDLLDVTRVKRGTLSLHLSPIDPGQLIADAVAAHEPIAEEKEITVRAGTSPEVSPIEADRDRLLQVFSNLVGNAIKFSPPRRTVRITAEEAGDEVLFSVADEGPGIDEADIPRLFQHNWQARKTAHLGAGLGLTISKGIVESHGGRIWVTSNPGRGATFSFTIPRTGPAQSDD